MRLFLLILLRLLYVIIFIAFAGIILTVAAVIDQRDLLFFSVFIFLIFVLWIMWVFGVGPLASRISKRGEMIQYMLGIPFMLYIVDSFFGIGLLDKFLVFMNSIIDAPGG